MIGCLIVGGLAVAGLAKLARYRCAGRYGCGGGRRWRHRHWGGSFQGRDGYGDGDGDGDGYGYGGADHEWLGGGPPWGHGSRGRWFDMGTFDGPAGDSPRSFLLRRVLRRLETTPSQERALREATKELEDSVRALKAEARRSRDDLAGVWRRSSVDEVVLGEMFARHDGALDSLRKAFVGWTIKVHDILDDTQRERLADLVERGPRFGRHFGPMAW